MFTLQIQFVFQRGGFHRCMISNLFRQVKHLLPFPTLGALPHFPLLPLLGKYFPRLSVNEYNAERLQHIISRWSKTIQTRLLRRKWHMGLILRQWWWLLVSWREGNGGKQRNPENTTDSDVENSNLVNCCWRSPKIQITGFWLPYTYCCAQTEATKANTGIFNVSNVKKIPQRTLAFGFSVLFVEWWHKDSIKTDLDTERLT